MDKKNIKLIYPLSPMQEGMLFHHVLDPNSSAYFQQFGFQLSGELDPASFEAAYAALLRRYDIFRTLFVHEKVARPVQVVLKEANPKLEFHDWTQLEPEVRLQQIDALKRQDRERGFNLTRELPMRMTLLRLEPQLHLVIWSFHHILMDGWCLGPVSKDFFELLAALRENREARLPPAPPYAAYIKWLEARNKQQAHQYWKTYLEGYSQTAGLPRAHRGGSGSAFRQEGVALRLSPADSQALRQRAADMRLTLSTLIQGFWGLLLQRYNGLEDVVFGTVVSGRPPELDGIERMVGLFINTVPVRVSAKPHTSFRELFTRLGSAALASARHDYLPLADIQAGSPLRSELIDHVLVFENYPLEEALASKDSASSPGGLSIGQVELFEQTHYDLAIAVVPGQSLEIRVAFNAFAYDESLMSHLPDHLEALIRAFLADPEQAVGGVDLLSESERTLLNSLNETQLENPYPRTIAAAFEQTAARNPEKVALVWEGKKLSYGALNQRADRLALALRQKGVGRESVVGILVERSFDMVVAVIGTLKAGGAYLPLDPNLPESRIRHMLDETEARIILSHGRLGERLPPGFETLQLEAFSSESATAIAAPIPPGTSNEPQDLAYVIYTSGSTGTPKGVAVEQRNVTNLRLFFEHRLGIGPDDVAIQFAPFSFDASAGELFMSLLIGTELHIIPDALLAQLPQFERYLDQNRVSFAAFPPPFLTHLDPNRIGSLRLLMSAGSAPSLELFHKWKEKVGYLNGYGPTETTVICTAWNSARDPFGGRALPIGRPVPNLRAYILDSQLNRLPPGLTGELCIGGEGLARGYLRQPALNAEKFVELPRSGGERIYRSGDLARLRPDGQLEFMGRLDHQVKIRGHRIELGEVEGALERMEGLSACTVVDWDDTTGNKHLVAYVVDSPGFELARVKPFLAARLPKYMVPDFVISLPALPLTANGKVDRKALPEPKPEGALVYVEPEGEFETELAAIWTEVLGVQRIGALDNFLEIGGHSLKAMAVASRIYKKFEIQVPLQQLFAAENLRALAATLAQRREGGAAIPKAEPAPAYPLSIQQQRIFVLSNLEGARNSYNMPGAMRLHGPLDPSRLEAAFRGLIARHESLRTSFGLDEEARPVQRIAADTDFELVRHTIAGDENPTELLRRFIRPFRLDRAPLIRAELVQLAPAEHLLFFDSHHIVSDGRSLEIILRELLTLYSGKELEALPIHYKDFAVWQKEFRASEAFLAQERFWLEALAPDPESGELPVLDLPLDHPRPPLQSFTGGHYAWRLDAELSGQLQRLALDTRGTLFSLMLAAYQTFLHKCSGQTDLIVGTPMSGRHRIELEGLIGMFVNTLALRNRPRPELRFFDFAVEVRQRAFAAFEFQDYPFELLLEKLDIPRDISRNPLFDTLFTFQEKSVPEIRVGDLLLEPLGADYQAAKFDLSLDAVWEDGRLAFSFEYARALFEPETIERLARHFNNLLASIAVAPHTPLAELDLLSPEERERPLLLDGGTTGHDCNVVFSRMFEARAAAVPALPALWAHGETWNYRRLNSRANQLARRLRELGVGRNQIVAVMTRRDANLVLAPLAVLKAGAAYLPLDPEYPPARVAYFLSDSGARILVTTREFSANLPQGIIPLFLDDEALFHGDDSDLELAATPEDLAYIIYTSGSTGLPKGVLIEQRGLCGYFHGQSALLELEEGRRILNVTTISFDIWVLEVWLALGHGLKVVIADETQQRDPRLLAHLIRDSGIDLMQTTPSRLKLLHSQDASLDCLAGVRDLLLGGEAFPHELLPILRRFPRLRIRNVYGPTETTVWATHKEVSERATLGLPLPNYRVLVLDSRLRPQPLGIYGEIHIGGECLGRGYHNRPELTRERFISDPFNPGGRLYKTGDQGRINAEGELEFRGRIDHQIKLRGFRIELGEIEAQILAHKEVAQAAVIVGADAQGEPALIAYYQPVACPLAEASPDSGGSLRADLRAALAAELPDYMVPAIWVAVESFALTPSGKLDRKALPKPAETQHAPEFTAPRDPLESQMAQVWGELFGREQIGIDDDFFALGGHSLRAIQFVAGMERLGSTVAVVDVFRYRNIREIAEFTRRNQGAGRKTLDPATALAALGESFTARFEFRRYQVGETRFNLLFTEAHLLKNRGEELLARLAEICADELLPHYIRPLGKTNPPNDGSRFDKPAFLKLAGLSTPGFIESPLLLQRLRKNVELTRDSLRRQVTSNPVAREYPISAIQKLELSRPFRGSGLVVALEGYLDHALLEKALLLVVAEQGLLRSVVLKRNSQTWWREFQPPTDMVIPFVDLSEHDSNYLETIMEKVLLKTTLRGLEGEDALLYSAVLVRLNLREQLLFFYIDHSIFDALSGEILRRDLILHYDALRRGRKPLIEPTRAYGDYVAQLRKGPAGLEAEEIARIFRLEAYRDTLSRLHDSLPAQRFYEMTQIDLAIDLPHSLPAAFGGSPGAEKGAIPREKIWELAFALFVGYCRKLLKTNQLPARVYSFGRKYQDQDFFHTIGEFYDKIPLVIDANLTDPLRMSAIARERIDLAAGYNINFATLLYDEQLDFRTEPIKALLDGRGPGFDRFFLDFNFRGSMNEREHEVIGALQDVSREKLGSIMRVESRQLAFQVHHTESRLLINLLNSFQPDAGVNRMLIKETARELFGN